MVKFKNLVSSSKSEIFLFIVLLGLIFLSSSFNLTIGYGITFTFTSICIFLVLRLFGLPLAILSAGLALIFVPHDNMHLAYGLIPLVEIFFVGAFFYKGRKAKMFFVDGLFWLTLGAASILALNWNYLSGNALYFQIFKDIVNGLFNVLIADMLLAYFPFYRFIKKINKNSVSIHQFLSHVTLISILVPFFLSIAVNAWNSQQYVQKNAIIVAKQNATRVEKELQRWKKEEMLRLSLYGTLQMNRLDEIVERNKSDGLDIIIQNDSHKVVATSTDAIELKRVYSWQHIFNAKKVSNGLFEALPVKQDPFTITQWAAGKYVYAKEFETLPLKVLIEFPIAQFQEQIYKDFLVQLKYSLIFAFCTVVLVYIVSRIIINNLKQLTVVTTGLPQKLVQFETMEWPHSYVSELRLLTQNLKKMADKLKELFQESNEMNQVLTEQTEKLKESEDKLHHLAYFDILTSLPNRLYFQKYVRKMIKKNPEKPLAIIFIDINQFKQINDTLGHDAGDSLLKMTAKMLSQLQTDDREIFRLGGDEFVLVHSINDREEVTETLEKILKGFSNNFYIQGQMLYITASVGISMYPEDGKDLDTLVKCADIAMYISKEKGGNIAQFFNESMRNKFQERLVIENALRAVVDKGGFELYYQPKTQGGKVTSIEALIRWNDPVLGFISPGTFIPIAEEIGLILQIDEWSLIQACKQNKIWHDEGLLKVPISANLSAKHFQQDYLVQMIERALNESGMDPKYLKLEITESVFIKDQKHVAEVIHKLKSLGVLISIDDFGKGYSSLYQLLQLPIDEIKVDRQFVKDIDQNERKALLVKSIMDIAHGLQLNVVAEGVETVNERDLLIQLGCNELQGYLFSPPINKQDMVKFLCKKEPILLN